MEKVGHIGVQIVKEIEESKHVDIFVKTALELHKNINLAVGTSLARITTAESTITPGDVYKTRINGHPFFYIVKKQIDGNMAFCITVYPIL